MSKDDETTQESEEQESSSSNDEELSEPESDTDPEIMIKSITGLDE